LITASLAHPLSLSLSLFLSVSLSISLFLPPSFMLIKKIKSTHTNQEKKKKGTKTQPDFGNKSKMENKSSLIDD